MSLHIEKITLRDTSSFSHFFLDYMEQKEELKDFYGYFPTLKNFELQLQKKTISFSTQNREVLYTSINEQYNGLDVAKPVRHNLEALKSPKTFTVTTGHQLNIFTGPLYLIYKIVTTINTCKELKKAYPDYSFIPVYWMASEDHDLEEIRQVNLYGKTYRWDTLQKGATGRLDPATLSKVLDNMPGDMSLFRHAYLTHQTLSKAVRYYINALFGDEGLIVVDADCRALKTLLRPVIEEDMFFHTIKKKVDQANRLLTKQGYTPQAHVRAINFFYLDKGIRNRIEKEKNQFRVVDTEITFSEEKIKSMIDKTPEKFSPNVVLRPLYQEVIMPNLAYVGGPSEIIYWMQLRLLFAQFNIPFPMLMPRNFALVIDASTARKRDKINLQTIDLFNTKDQLFRQWIDNHSPSTLNTKEGKKAMESLFETIKKKASDADVSLAHFVDKEKKHALARLDKIEEKTFKAKKRYHDDSLRQLEAIKSVLFPNQNLQERHWNFLHFYLEDNHFVQKIIDALDPFDYRFNVLSYPFS